MKILGRKWWEGDQINMVVNKQDGRKDSGGEHKLSRHMGYS